MNTVERQIESKFLNLAGGEGVKAKGILFLYMLCSGQITGELYEIFSHPH